MLRMLEFKIENRIIYQERYKRIFTCYNQFSFEDVSHFYISYQNTNKLVVVEIYIVKRTGNNSDKQMLNPLFLFYLSMLTGAVIRIIVSELLIKILLKGSL